MSFAEAARRLAGRAGLLLGWRPDEFWRVTPEELATAFAALTELVPDPGAEALDRATLARLQEIHPDG